MVRQENHDSTEWKPLAPGALTSFSKRVRTQRRRKQFARITMAAATLSLAILAAFALSLPLFNLPQQADPRFGGVTCSEVASRTKSFMAKELDQKLLAAIKLHLKQCSNCRRRMESLHGSQSVVSQAPRQNQYAKASIEEAFSQRGALAAAP